MHAIPHHAAVLAVLAVVAAVGLRLAFKMLRLLLVVAVPSAVYLLHLR